VNPWRHSCRRTSRGEGEKLQAERKTPLHNTQDATGRDSIPRDRTTSPAICKQPRGEVSLYVDGAFLGYPEVDFIAPGEGFELFLAVVDHLLRDRIPVSQTDQIRVSGIKVSPEGQPDTKGLLSWTVRLPPREAREYRVEYTIEYPTDLPSGSGQAGEDLRRRLQSLESLMATN
jgi:hypothetical protein